MDGQINRDGITKDLEAMARNGIGGVVLGDIGGTDEGPTQLLSPRWQELFAHTLREAKRLGLVISTCPSAGWCALGGPWIKPEDGMQVLVWSATRVTGPQEFAGILPQPQTVLGHYRDVAVIAFPSPNEPATEIKSINATGTKANARSLVDGNPQTVATFSALPKDKSRVIEIGFKKPVVLRGISVEFTNPPRLHNIRVEAAGSDGRFRRIGRFLCKFHGGDGSVVRAEIGFDKQEAERLRITLDSGGKVLAAKVAEMELFGENYLRGWTAKTVSHVSVSEAAAVDKDILTVPGIRPESIVNLTGKMSADGRLHWQVPEGQWTILRFGHTARGAKNRPAKAGQGFETDKFRRDVTKFHFDQYIGMMAEKHRKFMGTTLVAMWQDSWETGCQNWSPVFLEEFKRHRGYDPLLYLPAMTGRLVGNGALTERFLWDVRRTIADLAADNYLGALNDLGKPYGIGLWFQPINRHFFDGMQAVGRATGAEANMHFNRRDQQKRNYGGEKFCASAAHGYGQVVVHSEAATAYPPSGIFVETPASIRELVNANFCTGINNHWIHVFLHQPWQRAEPGLTWAWGLQFQRNNTWFEKLGGWSDYVARSQYMLRQGLSVVDIVCFIGEAVPTAAGPLDSVKELNNLPAGIDYDVCNAEIILTRMSVKDGRIVLPDGMSYALLYLPPKVEAVRPELLRKIRDLVRGGAILVGNRPTASPSLQNYPACDTEVNELADEIWGGKIGRVYPAEALKKAISELGLVGDFSFASANPDALIEYYHRRTADTDLYFVANRRPHPVEARCTFRVDGRLPELWHPDTGRIEPAGGYEIKDGRTTLPLRFDPHDAVFVVFRKPANKQVSRGKNWLEYKPL